MSVKIFAIREALELSTRTSLSGAIHGAMMEVLGLPEGKRAHRFIPLNDEDLFVPEGRSRNYITLEILLMTGRKSETKEQLIKTLFKKVKETCSIEFQDLELILGGTTLN